jgi:phage tail P2-like protein
MTSLLPPNASGLERAVEQAIKPHEHARIVPTLWNAQTCPASMLPWLAWACSVEDWDHTWPVEQKRAAIAASFDEHRHKGTPYAIRKALEVRGHPDAILVERADYARHDGTALRNGYRRRGGPTQWATYRVVLQRPITLDQAATITALLSSVTRNCCHLVALDYTRAALRHNGTATRNGQYTRGIIN